MELPRVDYTQPNPFSPFRTMLLDVKTQLAFLRHPSVTMSLFFMLSFREKHHDKLFVPVSSGSYAATPTGVALSWFCKAANGGSTYRGFVERGGSRIDGGGPRQEDYTPIEAAMFNVKGNATLIIQNASSEPRSLDPGELAPKVGPAFVEILAAEPSDDIPGPWLRYGESTGPPALY